LNWNGNDQVFKGYAVGDGKRPTMKVSGDLLTWDEVKVYKSFGAVLNKDFVDISFDSDELSEKFWKMAEKNNWNCLILENPSNGHIHSYWRDPEKLLGKDGADKKLSCGLIADIHSKGTYIPLKVDGVKRFPPSFEPDDIDNVPEELLPVKTTIDLLNLKEGEGRNQELFKYILVLQSQLGLDQERATRVLRNINNFVFDKPLSDKEFKMITRDEAFEEPIFFNGKTFLHDAFGRYLKNMFHIKRINGQLHVYDEGIYKNGYRFIESKMVELLPSLKSVHRTEVLKYLEITTPEQSQISDAKFIAFRNGIYDMETGKLLPFDPDIIITNLIPWDYNPKAYSSLCDKVLNKISCNDMEIRMLLEECIGYCFYRHNELSKSFFLTGVGSNGKSTYLDMIKYLLGKQNYTALNLEEFDERFSATTMFGKLANIGDDINDEFLSGKIVAQFKKIVSGNDIEAENKGQDVYFFAPTVKLLFSANDIPRMRSRGFAAIKRRLVIIPFNAKFSKDDPDYDGEIKWKLQKREVAEYLITLGLSGLKRVLINKGFTESAKVKNEISEFEKDNNPLLLFFEDCPEDEILNHETKEVFARYELFCQRNGYSKMAMQTFTKAINKYLECERRDIRVDGKKKVIFKRLKDD
jgi:putative DNA primase/helicase